MVEGCSAEALLEKASPVVELESDFTNPGESRRTACRGCDDAVRCETSPRPRAFRPPAPVEVKKAGRRALCPERCLEPVEGPSRRGVRLCEGRRWDIIGANHQCLPGRSRYIRLAEENVKGGKSYDPRKY